MNRLLKFCMVSVVFVVCAFVYTYSHIVHAMRVESSGFVSLQPGLYVSEQIDKAGQERFTAWLVEAKARVAQIYGPTSATPVTIVTQGLEEASQYGLGESPGTLFSTPWQQYLVLNYQRLAGADVIAHELVHAELGKRVGYVKRMLQIPTWYDEGVAMQVDFRTQYGIEGVDELAVKAVKELSSPAMFWTDDQAQTIENYRAAKKVVADLFEEKGLSSLYETLSSIESGKAFEEAVGLENTKAR